MSQNATVQNVARGLRDTHLPIAYLINDEGELCGAVTDRDFTLKVVAEFDTIDLPVSKIMTRRLVSLTEDSTVEHMVDVFERTGLRRLPVLNLQKSQIVGFVTIEDLIAGAAIESPRLTRMIRNQMKQWFSLNRRERDDAHSKQTLGAFYKKIAAYGHIPQSLVPEMSYFLIGAIVRRVSYTAALHLIAQLPIRLQDELLKLPVGPDREISVRAVLEEMIFRFDFTESYSRIVLRHFYQTLEEMLGGSVINHIKAQLSQDFRDLFSESKFSERTSDVEYVAKPDFDMRVRGFNDGEAIPRQFTGEGEDRSPGIVWSTLPDKTAELVLICEDPDAPTREPWVHWVVYNISPNLSGLPEGLPAVGAMDLPVRVRQGRNTWGNVGYRGPMPPLGHGYHRYRFKLYAVNKPIHLPAGATKEELINEMAGHVLSEAEVTGRYRREAQKIIQKRRSA